MLAVVGTLTVTIRYTEHQVVGAKRLSLASSLLADARLSSRRIQSSSCQILSTDIPPGEVGTIFTQFARDSPMKRDRVCKPRGNTQRPLAQLNPRDAWLFDLLPDIHFSYPKELR